MLIAERFYLIRIWHGKCIDLWIAKERRIECKRAPPSPKTDMSLTSMRCDSYTHPSSGGPISSYITSWTQLSSLPNDSWWPCSPMPPWQHISWRGIFVQRRYVATPPNLYPTPCLCRNTHAVPPGSHVTPDIIEREAPCSGETLTHRIYEGEIFRAGLKFWRLVSSISTFESPVLEERKQGVD